MKLSLESLRRRAQRGSALMLVFWLIAVLSLIIYGTVVIVHHDMELTIAQKAAFRARQLCEMGINIAMNPVVKEFDTALLNQGQGAQSNLFQLTENESLQTKIRGEGGRFNINGLLQTQDRVFFQRWFRLCGIETDPGDVLIDMMLDWTDQNEERSLHGMEKTDYEEAGIFGFPFNRPFYDLDEVLLVPGFDQVVAAMPDWRDYFTIYSTGKLDLNEAEPKVIALGMVAAVSTADPMENFEPYTEDAQEFVEQYRWGGDGIEDTQDDEKLQDISMALQALGMDAQDPEVSKRFGLNDATVHIEAIATVGEYRKRVVVVVRNRNASPQILTREEVPLSNDSHPLTTT